VFASLHKDIVDKDIVARDILVHDAPSTQR